MKFGILKFGFLILLLTPLFFLNILDSQDWGDDFAQYILQAKNLAEGKPQSETAYIFNPDYPFYAPPLYPVGYPVLLAPVYALFGNDVLAFNYFQTLLLFFFGIALFFFMRRWMKDLPALLLTLIAVYNPWMILFKLEIIADLSFALFMLLSTLAYLHYREKLNWGSAVLTGCLTGFTILIKPAAGVLLAAFAADMLLAQWRERAFEKETLKRNVILLFTPILLYLFVTYLLIPSSVETTGHFQNLYSTTEKFNKRFNINAQYYMNLFQDMFKYTNPDWNFSVVVLKAFALTLFLVGFFGRIFNRFGFVEILTLLFLLLVLFFPNTTQGFRYLLPVFAFMLLYIYYGFESIKLGRLNRKAVFIIACLFCLFQYKTTLLKIHKDGYHLLAGPQEPAAQQAFDYIRKNTGKDEVIAFIKPRLLSLYAERIALTNHPQQNIVTMKQFFEQQHVAYYLLLKDIPNAPLEKFLSEENVSIEVMWANEKFTLYRKKT